MDVHKDNTSETDMIVITAIDGTIGIEDLMSSEETKTLRNEDGSIWWRPSDQIALFYGGVKSLFTSTNTANAAVTQFSGYLAAAVGGGEGVGEGSYFYGLYPYDPESSITNGLVTTTVPAVQQAITGSFAQDSFVTLARSENTGLAFYNLCGGFKFKITHEGVKKVVITGHNNETLAGKVNIAFDGNIPVVDSVVEGEKSIILNAPEGGYFETGEWYMAVVLPTVFTSGLDFTFYGDWERGTYSRTAATTISRSRFGTFKAIDSKVTYEEWIDPALVINAPEVSVAVNSVYATASFEDVRNGNEGWYACELKLDGAEENIVELYNMTLEPGLGLTFAGLEAETAYQCRFRAEIPGHYCYWSDWVSFTTASASSSYVSADNMFADFNDLVGYGLGDLAAGYPSVIPGAEDVFAVDGTYLSIGSDNANEPSVTGLTDLTECYARPGYLQIGTESAAGSAKAALTPSGSADAVTYKISFKGFVIGGGNATLAADMTATCNYALYPIDHTASGSVELAGDSWQDYELTLTCDRNKGVFETPEWLSTDIVFSTASGSPILLDNLSIVLQ